MNARVTVVAVSSFMLAAAMSVAAERQSRPAPLGEANRPHRSLSAIQLDVHAALRAEASTRRLGPNVPQVLRLINLHREFAAHPKRDKSEFLTRLALRVRSRLENVRDHIQRRDSRSDRHVKRRTVPPTIVVPETQVLAQQFVVPGGAAQAQGPGGAETIDYGPELVDLIQRTISPTTWDINGGNGSVVYFAPRHAIVVSAPANVHDQVGDVLGQLRAAP